MWRPPIPLLEHLRPQAIARCRSAADVAEALAHARRHGLAVAARSGGHCFGGRSSTEGLLVDVGPMNGVTVGDGVATIGAGARLGEVYDALDAHGLTIAGGCGPTVGIAGLTLGGGLGILGRTYGLTCDQLLGAEVVLADGRVLEVSDGDLLWALRGAGGGRFGVVTAPRAAHGARSRDDDAAPALAVRGGGGGDRRLAGLHGRRAGCAGRQPARDLRGAPVRRDARHRGADARADRGLRGACGRRARLRAARAHGLPRGQAPPGRARARRGGRRAGAPEQVGVLPGPARRRRDRRAGRPCARPARDARPEPVGRRLQPRGAGRDRVPTPRRALPAQARGRRGARPGRRGARVAGALVADRAPVRHGRRVRELPGHRPRRVGRRVPWPQPRAADAGEGGV